MEKCKKIAFTLTEAIIVIVMLGIIAAVCIAGMKPHDAHQQGLDTKGEKAISTLSQVVLMMFANDVPLDDFSTLSDSTGSFSITDVSNIGRFVNIFKKYLAINDLGMSNAGGYFDEDLYTYKKVSKGKLNSIYSNFLFLNDDIVLGFRLYGSCTADEENAIVPYKRDNYTIANVCGSIFMDVNGFSKPNKMGSDQFVIPFDQKGIKLND